MITRDWVRRTALLGFGALAACAWSNPDNRPVWNAFEQHLVPDDPTWYFTTLPLTIPAGLGALLVDTLVVHPAQVMDDAADDAGQLWVGDDPDWDGAYYTEMAFLPFRAVVTPLVFAGSFLGRSLFDIDGGGGVVATDADADQAAREKWQRDRRLAFLRWLNQLAEQPFEVYSDLPEWRDDMAAPLDHARRLGPLARITLHTCLLAAPPTGFGDYDPSEGLRDPDPVVRYTVLQRWPSWREIPADTLELLRSDANQAVRDLAAWHQRQSEAAQQRRR